MRSSTENVKLNSISFKNTNVLKGIRLGFSGGFESSLFQSVEGSSLNLQTVPINANKKIKYVGFYT